MKKILFTSSVFLFLFLSQILTVHGSHLKGACFIIGSYHDGGIYVFEVADKTSSDYYAEHIAIWDVNFTKTRKICEGSEEFTKIKNVIDEELEYQKNNGSEATYPAIKLPSINKADVSLKLPQ